MKFGQITNAYKNYSTVIDYIQFDICGLDANEALERLNNTLSKNKHIKKIILHSDWTKNGCSENNLPTRINEYINIFNTLSQNIDVIGITLHPMFRSKSSIENFLILVSELSKHMNVFIENRSNSRILISLPNEVIDLSHSHNMTIDIPQLLISCNYDYQLFLSTLSKINWNNIKEIHLANVKRVNNRTFVGRSLDDGEINIKDLAPYLKNKLITLEILGGVNAFEKNIELLKEIIC